MQALFRLDYLKLLPQNFLFFLTNLELIFGKVSHAHVESSLRGVVGFVVELQCLAGVAWPPHVPSVTRVSVHQEVSCGDTSALTYASSPLDKEHFLLF